MPFWCQLLLSCGMAVFGGYAMYRWLGRYTADTTKWMGEDDE